MSEVMGVGRQGRLAPGTIEKLEAAMAEAWAAVDAAWKRLAAKDAAVRAGADRTELVARVTDGWGLGGGGGDRSTIGLP